MNSRSGVTVLDKFTTWYEALPSCRGAIRLNTQTSQVCIPATTVRQLWSRMSYAYTRRTQGCCGSILIIVRADARTLSAAVVW